MFRSIWFWAIAILVVLALWFGRDQITSFFQSIPMDAPKRTTNTQALAASTPSSSSSSLPVSSSTRSLLVTVTPVAAIHTTRTVVSAGQVIAAAPVAAATASPKYATYIVKKGDTLYSIAKSHRTNVETLQKINQIDDPSTLYVGQELKVPAPTSAPRLAKPVPKPGATVYTVQKGDSLSSVARKFHTSVGELQKLNKLPNPNELVVGSSILVPASASSTASPVSHPANASTSNAPSSSAHGAASSMNATKPVATLSPTPTSTPTPIPTAPSVCGAANEAVFVWGVSFCVPAGWDLQEYPAPHRTALLTRDEESNDRSLYAISRLDGSPNAPLSWSMRQAKKSISNEIASLIPGGLATPEDWTLATGVSIAGSEGQMSEARSAYLKTGHPAHIRVIVFNHADQRWRIVIVAPEELWQSYNISVFPFVVRTLEVF